MDDAYRLRDRQDDAGGDVSQVPTPTGAGARCVVGITADDGDYPDSASKFYAMSTQDVLGTETEGSSGSLTTLSDRFFALNLGSGVPPVGTSVICTFVAWRWVFRYDTIEE